MAPHLASLKVPANVTFSVLPKPLQMDNLLYFAVAKDKDDGVIDMINAALARQRRTAALKTQRVQ